MAPSVKRELDDDESQIASAVEYRRPKKRAKVAKATSRNRRTATEQVLATEQFTATGQLGEDLFQKLPGELRNRIYNLVLTEDDTIDIRPKDRCNRAGSLDCNGKYRLGTSYEPRWSEPGLLRASKWIRHEAKAIYYQNNEYKVTVRSTEIQKAYDWMRSTIDGARSEDRRFNLGGLDVSKICWKDIHLWLPLAEIVRDLDVGLTSDSYVGFNGRYGGRRYGRSKKRKAKKVIKLEEEGDVDVEPRSFFPHTSNDQGFRMGSLHRRGCNIGGMKPSGQALRQVALLGLRASEEEWDELTLEMEFEECVETVMSRGNINSYARSSIERGFGRFPCRLMMEAEGGRNDGPFRAYAKRIEPRTMRLRSDLAPQ